MLIRHAERPGRRISPHTPSALPHKARAAMLRTWDTQRIRAKFVRLTTPRPERQSGATEVCCPTSKAPPRATQQKADASHDRQACSSGKHCTYPSHGELSIALFSFCIRAAAAAGIVAAASSPCCRGAVSTLAVASVASVASVAVPPVSRHPGVARATGLAACSLAACSLDACSLDARSLGSLQPSPCRRTAHADHTASQQPLTAG